ncbi:MAG: spore cortex-lytic enzyme [Clostridia bacterium]|nr:spore cortex-lytic enzyme [Clostridia bacterium]
MNKRNAILVSIALVLTVFVAGYAVFGHVGEGGVQAVFGENSVVETLTLKQGSSGQTVKTLQTKLKKWGYYTGSIDGIYGKNTKNAVIYFQRKNGLVADGIAGPKTLAAMGISAGSATSTTTSGGSYTSADTNLLAKLIYAEARGEPYTGQVAVGAVVLNRVKSSSFPNTISGVIYQPYAFTCVSDGQINMTPNASALNAARDAMNGYDPTSGCLYYYNPAIATSKWIFSRKTMITIGNHVFAL